MRLLTLVGLSLVFALPQGAVAQKAAGCDALGNVQFICGVVSPEDLVVVPGSEWVIASGDAAGGAIRLINVRDRDDDRAVSDRGAEATPGRQDLRFVSRPDRPRRKRTGSGRTASLFARAAALCTLSTSFTTAPGNRSKCSSWTCGPSRRP